MDNNSLTMPVNVRSKGCEHPCDVRASRTLKLSKTAQNLWQRMQWGYLFDRQTYDTTLCVLSDNRPVINKRKKSYIAP